MTVWMSVSMLLKLVKQSEHVRQLSPQSRPSAAGCLKTHIMTIATFIASLQVGCCFPLVAGPPQRLVNVHKFYEYMAERGLCRLRLLIMLMGHDHTYVRSGLSTCSHWLAVLLQIGMLRWQSMS